jgi:hypothetical protein
MGDGILKINFFSGTGVNFGLEIVDSVYSLLHTNSEINKKANKYPDLISDDQINFIFSKSVGSLKFNLEIPSNINPKLLINYIISQTDLEIGKRLQTLITNKDYTLPILELFSTFKDGPDINIYDELIKKYKVNKCRKKI